MSPSKSGEQLRVLRERAHITGRRLAHLAGMSQSKISKIERGYMLPSSADILQLASALHVSGDVTDRWLSLLAADANQRRQRNDLGAYYFAQEVEEHARQVDSLLTNTLPALLQTPEYTAHYLGHRLSDDELQDVLHLRLKRQSQLFKKGVVFRFLIREQAFFTFSDAREMWCHQLDVLGRFLAVCRHPVRVLKDGDAARFGLNDEIIIIDNAQAYYEVPIFRTIRYADTEERLAIQTFSQAWAVGAPLTPEYLSSLTHRGSKEVDLREVQPVH